MYIYYDYLRWVKDLMPREVTRASDKAPLLKLSGHGASVQRCRFKTSLVFTKDTMNYVCSCLPINPDYHTNACVPIDVQAKYTDRFFDNQM